MRTRPQVLHFSLALLFTLTGFALAPSAAAQIVFEPPVGYDAGILAGRLALGDVNADGFVDAVVSHFAGFGDAPSLALGQAGGGFGAAQGIANVNALGAVSRLADFDEDGHLDLLTCSPWTNGSASVHFGDGQGDFGPPLNVNSNHTFPADSDVGDFDADGDLDIAILNGITGFLLPGSVTVRFGHGDGSFAPPVVMPVAHTEFSPSDGILSTMLRVADTNGDGFDDIVFNGVNPVRLSLGDGSFTPASCAGTCVTLSGADYDIADVTGDGRDDVLTPTGVYLALPNGSLASPLPLATEFFHFRIAAGDFDADGLVDVMVGRNESGGFLDRLSTFGDVVVLRGQGNGSFSTTGVVVSHVPQPYDIVPADLDLDGRLDAAVTSMVDPAPTLRTLRNFTYAPGSPFLDLGGALGGSNGWPIQLASGTLVAGQPFSFKLQSGPPSGAAFHIVGLSRIDAPFKGGVMIPALNLVNGPFPLTASGALNLAGNWPAGASGLTLYVQYWMPNGGGPVGLVASNGVCAQVP